MAIGQCCQLVGSYPIDVDGIISISTRSSTETSFEEPNLIIGPTIGNLSVNAYAGVIPGTNSVIRTGCPVRINVNVPWLRKYDCDTNTVHFIFQGQGNASMSGGADKSELIQIANFYQDAVSYRIVNASASSGPASVYEDSTQYDGYGLAYYGGPWSFETSEEGAVMIDTGIADFGPLPLSNFSFTAEPGQPATVTYEFLIAINN